MAQPTWDHRTYSKKKFVEIKPLNAEEDGVYTAEKGCAFNPVTVDLSDSLAEKTITENNVYIATDDDAYGYSKVTVNVESSGSLGSPVQVQLQALDTDDTPYWTNLYASRLYVYADAIGDTVPLPPEELPNFEVGNIDVFTAPAGLGVVVLISASNLSTYGRHVQVLIDDETQPVTFITQEVPQLFNPDVKDLAVAFTMPEVTNGNVYLRIDNE